MEESVSKLTVLYNLYKDSPNTLQKLEFYIHKQLPALLDKFNEQEKRRMFLEKESNIYINEFLTNPDQQFFYIQPTDSFIKYDGENYSFINEDDLWMIILSDITEKVTLVDWKQKIKNTIIKNIKEKSLFNTIPESSTVQFVINFFTPMLLTSKEDVKYFMTLIGDNILNKNTGLSYFVPIESKSFFDALESTCQYYFRSKLNIAQSIRYRYRGEDYNKSRIVYFTKSINNKACWLSFLKDNLFNFLVVCCHYSTRYINADSYVNKRNITFKNKILYLKNNTKENIIGIFLEEMILQSTDNSISLNDIYFLWKIYLKNKNIPNTILKTEFELILKNKLLNNNNNFLDVKSNYLDNVKLFKRFWDVTINRDVDDEIEISEIHTLLMKWIETNNKTSIGFTEDNLRDMIEYFYDDITVEKEKFLLNTSCNLWDKQGDMLEAFQHKFNKPIEKDITIYESYVMYCKYANNNGKLMTVSKKYYYKYIGKVIPNQYIINGRILLNYWNN